MRKYLPLLLLIVLTGCSNPSEVALMGQWAGGFKADDPKTDIYKFEGYIQLYARSQYKMHLDTPHQGYDVVGTWKKEGNRLTMSVGKITYQSPTEQDQEIFHWKVAKQVDIQKAYGKAFVLQLDASGKTLTGQSMTIGGVEGQHVFQKRLLNQ